MSDNLATRLANPAPLGLLGFGLTTVLLNLVNAGVLTSLDTVILAMGIAYGGIAQIIVGIMEFKKGNTFGTVAFTSYGLFWWSLVITSAFARFNRFYRSFDFFTGSLLLSVGSFHFRNVLWYTKSKSRITIRFPKLNNTVLFTNDTRIN